MKAFALPLCAGLFLAALPATADDVSDTLKSALEAYEAGDIQYAMEEIAFAQQLLKEMKADSLTAFLPEAPDGWTREIDTEMAATLGMLGGGVGTKASYSDGSDSFTLTLMADNPMVAAMGSAGLMGGKMIRVGREKFADQDGQLIALIGNRVLVQAEGQNKEAMRALLETMDFRALASFGQ
ncbi:hypothetical protein PSA7680_01439 [Pseudoruegeria aquimaris]|uniref:Uncharacterized protein n=1 Tax=Pseudoruegeria aquimaris TaxID=393663 RepID=A0A1Y5S5H0_9RHOB|nr:hypothetical protein [Pseudoruegeria aquimaris]SLN30225.1 hypothetical protein PSA7680_01439 [Pseudoruegeria aquimaris]